MNNMTKEETTLQIKRTFRATQEQVFQAWTNPEALKKWFGPTDDFTTPVAEVVSTSWGTLPNSDESA